MSTPTTPSAASKKPERKYEFNEELRLLPRADELCTMARSGNYEGLKALIQRIPFHERVSYVNQRDAKGFLPIHHCFIPMMDPTATPANMSEGRYNCCILLVEYGADLNLGDTATRNTPLHHACRMKHAAMIKQLIAMGANVFAENASREKPEQVPEQEEFKRKASMWATEGKEAFVAGVKEKTIAVTTPHQISFFRSIFDILDTNGLGMLRFEDISSLLETEHPDDEKITIMPQMKEVFAYFMNMDRDHDGLISFQEFLLGGMAWMNDADKADGKGGKKKKKKKKRKKK